MTVADLLHVCRERGIRVSIHGTVCQADAAALLSISLRTLQRWRAEGIGPTPQRLGKRWRYALADLADVSRSVASRAAELSTGTDRQRHACARPGHPCSISRRSRIA